MRNSVVFVYICLNRLGLVVDEILNEDAKLLGVARCSSVEKSGGDDDVNCGGVWSVVVVPGFLKLHLVGDGIESDVGEVGGIYGFSGG